MTLRDFCPPVSVPSRTGTRSMLSAPPSRLPAMSASIQCDRPALGLAKQGPQQEPLWPGRAGSGQGRARCVVWRALVLTCAWFGQVGGWPPVPRARRRDQPLLLGERRKLQPRVHLCPHCTRRLWQHHVRAHSRPTLCTRADAYPPRYRNCRDKNVDGTLPTELGYLSVKNHL